MNEESSYYAVIPAPVRYDRTLPAAAKLLYGEITALCKQRGYCWATNEYFAKLYGVSEDSVTGWISKLKKAGHILIDPGKERGNERHIYLSVFVPVPIGNFSDTLSEKTQIPYPKNFRHPIGKISDHNNTVNNTCNNTSENKSAEAPVLVEKNDVKAETAKRSKKPPRVAAAPPTVRPDQFAYETSRGVWAVITWPEQFTEAMRSYYLDNWLPYHRGRSGRRLTEQGITEQLNELGQLDEPQFFNCLKKSITNNWQGFFVDKYLNHANPKNPDVLPRPGHERPNYGAGAVLPPGSAYTKQSFRRRSDAPDRNRIDGSEGAGPADGGGDGHTGSGSAGGV